MRKSRGFPWASLGAALIAAASGVAGCSDGTKGAPGQAGAGGGSGAGGSNAGGSNNAGGGGADGASRPTIGDGCNGFSNRPLVVLPSGSCPACVVDQRAYSTATPYCSMPCTGSCPDGYECRKPQADRPDTYCLKSLAMPSDVGTPCDAAFGNNDCDIRLSVCLATASPTCQASLCARNQGASPYCTRLCDLDVDPSCPVGFECTAIAMDSGLSEICLALIDLGKDRIASHASTQCDGQPFCAFQTPLGDCSANVSVRVSDTSGYCSAHCSKFVGCPDGYTCQTAVLVDSFLSMATDVCVKN